MRLAIVKNLGVIIFFSVLLKPKKQTKENIFFVRLGEGTRSVRTAHECFFNDA